MRLPPSPLPGRSWRVVLCLLAYSCIFVGLIFSPVLLSIGLIGIPFAGVLDPQYLVNPVWVRRLKRLVRDPFSWALAGFYLIVVLGFWQTYDWDYYLGRLRIKSVLMAAPIGWVGLPRLHKKEVQAFLAGCVILLSGLALLIMGNYLLHWETINQAIREGQAMPVPRNHIRFSLLVAITTLISLDLGRQDAWKRSRLWFFLAAFLFAFQHLLAVRSGLALAYGGLIVYALVYGLVNGHWKPLLLGFCSLLIVGTIALNFVPSLKAKFDYLSYEIWRQEQGLDSSDYSDAGRFTSIQIGWEIFEENPVFGIGPGNLLAETDRRYQQQFGIEKGKRPHNQFVSTLAGSGWLGGIIFCTSAGFLLFGSRARRRNLLFLSIGAVLFGSMLVENTLETSTGVALFTFFVLFFRPGQPLLRGGGSEAAKRGF